MADVFGRMVAVFKRRTLRQDKEGKYMNFDWDRDQSYAGAAYVEETEHGDYEDSRSISSFSTNATMDDIPGPGRILDKCLYQYLGRKVERLAFRMSISYLHPNRICQYLWENNKNYMPYGSRYPRPLGEVLDNIHELKGSACVAGLKSLVHQAQSSSVFQSASALAALIRLSTSLTAFSDFYVAVATVEPLFHLELLIRALDDSHPKKTHLLCLTTLARVRLQFTSDFENFKPSVEVYTQLESSPEFACKLRRDLLEVLGSLRSSGLDLLQTLNNACILFAKASTRIAVVLRYNIEPTQAIESIVETTYFLIHLLISLYDRAICHSMLEAQRIEYFVPFLTLKKTRTMLLFPEVHQVIERCDPIDRSLLPRRFLFNAQPVFQRYTAQYTSRSCRLLSSLKRLEREVREASHSESTFARRKEWSEEELRISLGRAEQVRVHENDVTHQFIKARDQPHQSRGDFRFWRNYKERCYMRQKWGEHLRSYLDWDWDSGGCLKLLFRIERPAKKKSTKATFHADSDMDNVQGSETLNVYIGAIRARSLKAVRVAYHTNSGEMKYRTFYANSSIGDVDSAPCFTSEHIPAGCPNGAQCRSNEVSENDGTMQRWLTINEKDDDHPNAYFQDFSKGQDPEANGDGAVEAVTDNETTEGGILDVFEFKNKESDTSFDEYETQRLTYTSDKYRSKVEAWLDAKIVM